MRIRHVADVQNQRRLLYFLERRAERCKQSFRQVTNKSDGIGEQHAAIREQADRTDGRVKSSKHFRGHQDLGAAQCIEQGRFAGVGVAHQRNGSQGHGIARFTAQRPLPANLVNSRLNLADALANPASVGFEFFLARAANADSPCAAPGSTCATPTALTAKTGHCRALPRQARQQVIQLCQLHLQLAFAASRMTGENVENKLRAVNYAAIGDLFDVSLLYGRKVAVENDERRFVRRSFRADFVQFPAADKRGGIGGLSQLKDGSRNFRAGTTRQFNQFGKGLAARLARGHAGKARRTLPPHAHKQGALRSRDGMRCFRHGSRLGVTIRLCAFLGECIRNRIIHSSCGPRDYVPPLETLEIRGTGKWRLASPLHHRNRQTIRHRPLCETR